jgi:hypothetical protein
MSHLDESHKQLKNWAFREAKKIITFLSNEELEEFFVRLVVKTPQEIESDLSGYIDITQPAGAEFMANLLHKKSKI